MNEWSIKELLKNGFKINNIYKGKLNNCGCGCAGDYEDKDFTEFNKFLSEFGKNVYNVNYGDDLEEKKIYSLNQNNGFDVEYTESGFSTHCIKENGELEPVRWEKLGYEEVNIQITTETKNEVPDWYNEEEEDWYEVEEEENYYGYRIYFSRPLTNKKEVSNG